MKTYKKSGGGEILLNPKGIMMAEALENGETRVTMMDGTVYTLVVPLQEIKKHGNKLLLLG